MKKVITRIKGGLGNQLFCYCAARRFAIMNRAELVIDNISGFARDFEFKRSYSLSHFNIKARFATQEERLEPFERFRRGFIKWCNRPLPLSRRYYIEEILPGFDQQMLDLRPNKTVYLDGLWQNERYFKDIESIIRQDLVLNPPEDTLNLVTSANIKSKEAVSIHVRFFDRPGVSNNRNLTQNYYRQSIRYLDRILKAPSYFVFSDDPVQARRILELGDDRATYINHNDVFSCAHLDLWLMSQCKHHIIANSTFSWWGAWLAENPDKITIYPNKEDSSNMWNPEEHAPVGWLSSNKVISMLESSS